MNTISMVASRGWWALCLAAALCGCGGGAGTASSPQPPVTPATPLPDSLGVTAPATAEAGSELQFASAAGATAGLSFVWDFGDGKTSTEASPKHQYAKGGDYDVKLKVSNAAGASKEQVVSVSITNLNNVKGLTCSKDGDGGWCWQQPLPHGNPRTDAFFTSATTLFVTGEAGEINLSTDAGASWATQRSGVTSGLTAVRFSSAQHGWILTSGSAVLRTTDAGASWSRKAVPDALLHAFGGRLIAVDDQTAIAGTSGLYTTDGGDHWALHAFGPDDISQRGVFWALGADARLRRSGDFGRTGAVVVNLPAEGYVAGTPYFNLVGGQTVAVGWDASKFDAATGQLVGPHTLLLSFDDGQTWRRTQPSMLDGAPMPTVSLRIIRASASDDTLLARMGNQLVSSADGGTRWSRVKLPRLFATGEGALAAGSTVLLPTASLFGTQPSERGLAWSADGGLTWSEATVAGVSASDGAGFTNLREVQAGVFSVQDSQGRFFLSTDGGRNWQRILDNVPLRTYSPGSPWLGEPSMRLAFLDAKRGLNLDAGGRLQETLDGGRSWKPKATTGLPLTSANVALRLVDDTRGWLLQADGRLHKTSDGGATWRDGQLVAGGLLRFDFADAARGWGEPSDRRGLVFTRDGGQTWARLQPPQALSLGGLFFGPGQQILVYGPGALLASTTDEGKSWTVLAPNGASPFELRRKVMASDAKVWWSAMGDALYRSEDAGVTWVQVATGQFADIAFADASHGWAVGRRGAVIATTDGGKTWTSQPTRTLRDLWRIQAIDGKTAWIEGEAGTVLATGNGGQ